MFHLGWMWVPSIWYLFKRVITVLIKQDTTKAAAWQSVYGGVKQHYHKEVYLLREWCDRCVVTRRVWGRSMAVGTRSFKPISATGTLVSRTEAAQGARAGQHQPWSNFTFLFLLPPEQDRGYWRIPPSLGFLLATRFEFVENSHWVW